VDVEALREQFVGVEFDTAEFRVDPDDALAFAQACGETDARYTDPAHPEYQAPPTFTTRFVSRRTMPESFPTEGFRRSFDGGKCVVVHAPIRVGTRLTATSSIAEVYRKTGRSGGMTFIVHRMEFRDDASELVSTVDWRMVARDEV
jgi:hypothetical protein